MSACFDRAMLFFQLSQFGLAEQELRQELATEPNRAEAHVFLSLCLYQRGQYHEALQGGLQAIDLAPRFSLAYYLVARCVYRYICLLPVYNDKCLSTAQATIEKAIRLSSGNADYFALLALIQLSQGDHWHEVLMAQRKGILVSGIDLGKIYWRGGLEATEQGLKIDPEHSDCIALQLIILDKLGVER